MIDDDSYAEEVPGGWWEYFEELTQKYPKRIIEMFL